MDGGLAERLTALEARVARLEDEREILRLLATYGPLVDSGQPDAAARLYCDGAFLDVVGYQRQIAPHDIAAGLDCDEQRAMNAGGCMHLVSAPRLELDGDSARATTYNLVVLRQEGRFDIWRGAVNRWVFARTVEGWKIAERYSSEVDGSDAAFRLMQA